MKAVFDAYTRSTADVRAVIQSVSPIEVIPTSYPEVTECFHLLPIVVEW
jgi:hypothetical protein